MKPSSKENGVAEDATIREKEDEEDSVGVKKPGGGGRKRHKAVYKNIVKQMEFYFGDANLSKSQFMSRELAKGPWINLDVFLTFNKLKSMLTASGGDNDEEQKDLFWKAVEKIPSELLDTKEDEDGNRFIKRKLEFSPRTDDDQCTLYVEKIPLKFGTAEAIEAAFSKYGKVVYVSLPKYKRTGAVKGFAFVQFENWSETSKALAAFGVDDEVAKNSDPSELESIKTFQQEHMMELQEEREEKQPEQQEPKKEPKDESDLGDEPPRKKTKTEEEAAMEPEEESLVDTKKKKKNRKHKTNKAVSSSTATGSGSGQAAAVSEQRELKLSQLRIMSKIAWKRLRNQYLNQQRTNMAQSKRRLHQWRIDSGQQPQKEQQDTKQQQQQQPQQPCQLQEQEQVEEKPFVQLPFFPNTIVKFSLKEPIDDKKMLKKKVSSAFLDPVSYVDADVGKSEYHVRCANEEQARKLAGVACLGSAVVLTGNDESSYWERIQEQRKEKREGAIKKTRKGYSLKKQKRGRDRHVEKVEEMRNSHTYFGDDDT